MPKLLEVCGNCGIIKEEDINPKSKRGRRFVQKLKTAQIRYYIPENPAAKRSEGEKKGEFKHQYIKISLFCPKCLNFFPNKDFKNTKNREKLFPLQEIDLDDISKYNFLELNRFDSFTESERSALLEGLEEQRKTWGLMVKPSPGDNLEMMDNLIKEVKKTFE
ncbi:MAG: hypothetical protein ACFFDB_00610 [Promethearchaeota archaeon]